MDIPKPDQSPSLGTASTPNEVAQGAAPVAANQLPSYLKPPTAETTTAQVKVNAETAGELLTKDAIPAAKAMTPEADSTDTSPQAATAAFPNDTIGEPDTLVEGQKPLEALPAPDVSTLPTPASTPEATTPAMYQKPPPDSTEGASI